jgi:hypothetical protein
MSIMMFGLFEVDGKVDGKVHGSVNVSDSSSSPLFCVLLEEALVLLSRLTFEVIVLDARGNS